MKNAWFCCVIFFAFMCCTPEDKKIPKDIMPVNKMKLVIWDLMQAGDYASYLKDKDSSLKRVNTVYLAEVLKLHKISKTDFFKSFNFYQSHPLLNQALFDSVNAYAQRQRNAIYKRVM